MTVDWTNGSPIAPHELPAEVTAYLEAHKARDVYEAIGHYASDATVTDEGRTFVGLEEIRNWLEHSASEYEFTTELTSARQSDHDRFVAVHHLAGNFPGGQVDLEYRFALRNGLITELVIEPPQDDDSGPR